TPLAPTEKLADLTATRPAADDAGPGIAATWAADLPCSLSEFSDSLALGTIALTVAKAVPPSATKSATRAITTAGLGSRSFICSSLSVDPWEFAPLANRRLTPGRP